MNEATWRCVANRRCEVVARVVERASESSRFSSASDAAPFFSPPEAPKVRFSTEELALLTQPENKASSPLEEARVEREAEERGGLLHLVEALVEAAETAASSSAACHLLPLPRAQEPSFGEFREEGNSDKGDDDCCNALGRGLPEERHASPHDEKSSLVLQETHALLSASPRSSKSSGGSSEIGALWIREALLLLRRTSDSRGLQLVLDFEGPAREEQKAKAEGGETNPRGTSPARASAVAPKAALPAKTPSGPCGEAAESSAIQDKLKAERVVYVHWKPQTGDLWGGSTAQSTKQKT